MVETRRSSILGPDGQPVQVALLTQEKAAATDWGVRSVHRLRQVVSGLTPESLAAIMQQAAIGMGRQYLTLAIEMEERYLHYASQLQTRRLAFEGVPTTVTAPKGVPAKIVDFVQSLTEEPSFRIACSDLMDGVSKGYSVVEPIWEYRDGFLKPVRYEWRDPRYFVFDRTDLKTLLLAKDTGWEGDPLPPGGFIVHMPHTRTGLPLRRGLARSAAWAFLIQSFTLQDWAGFCEIYGIPFRIGKYGAGASDEDKRSLLRAVRALANDAAAIMPIGMEIEIVEANGAKGEAVFGGLLGYLDRNISKLVVGQTMTADDGASLGQAKIHNEVRIDILRADCWQAEATINRDLIQWAVAMNFGPQTVYPRVHFPVAEPQDIKALSETLQRLVPLGMKVGMREVRGKIGLSDPEPDEEVLTPPPVATPKLPALPSDGGDGSRSDLSLRRHVAGCRCRNCAPARLAAGDPDQEEIDTEDELDRVQAGALDDWAEIVDPMLEGLFALAAEAGSYDEVLRKLDGLRLDSGPLRERLARATAIARGIGDTEH